MCPIEDSTTALPLYIFIGEGEKWRGAMLRNVQDQNVWQLRMYGNYAIYFRDGVGTLYLFALFDTTVLQTREIF